MGEFIFGNFALASGHKVFGIEIPERRLHTTASLASEAGLYVRTVRNVLIAQGLVPADDEQVQATFDAEVGRKVAGSIVRLIAANGLLIPIVDEFLEGYGRVRKAFDACHVADFRENLHNAARSVSFIADDLVLIAKAAEWAKVSSGEIIHMILGRHLETVVRRADSEGLAG